MKLLFFIVFIVAGIPVLSGSYVAPTPIGEIDSLSVNYRFSLSDINVTNRGFLSVNVSGANSFLIQHGYPILPCRTEVFHLPFESKILSIDVSINNVHRYNLPGKIEPSPYPCSLGFDSNPVDFPCKVVYDFDVYPEDWFSYRVGCGIYRGEYCVFLTVDLYPVRYSPWDDEIIVVDSMSIDITYSPPMKVSSDPPSKEYQLVIISPSEFAGDLQVLVDHKISRGVSTKLVLLDEIYNGLYFPVSGRDDAEKIKYFIKDAIEEWDTTFILLVGGIDKIPSRETHVEVSSNDREVFVSD
ncbi:MAG TPA: hypothetical protein ENG62_02095, partial [Thermoplasmatales archaeon]|nr:hypothetical protein [Thermoplasmatales archaeon]